MQFCHLNCTITSFHFLICLRLNTIKTAVPAERFSDDAAESGRRRSAASRLRSLPRLSVPRFAVGPSRHHRPSHSAENSIYVFELRTDNSRHRGALTEYILPIFS